MRASFRTPKKDWSAPTLVSKLPFSGLHLDVARDGTAVTAGELREGSKPIVFAATRAPGMKRFEKMRRVNRGSGTPGNYLSVAASTRGRASVAWGGICPLFDPTAREPVRVAESGKKGRFALPRTVAGTKCPSYGIDIQRDPVGRSYLLVNGSFYDRQHVRASIRRPRKWFGRAKVLNRKWSSSFHGELTLSKSGIATVVWQDHDPKNGIRPWLSYSYSQASRKSGFSQARKLPAKIKEHYLVGATATKGRQVIVFLQSLTDYNLISTTIRPSGVSPATVVAQPSGENDLVDGDIVGRADGATAIWSETDRASGNLTDLDFADCRNC
jgi:hypothetical protein